MILGLGELLFHWSVGWTTNKEVIIHQIETDVKKIVFCDYFTNIGKILADIFPEDKHMYKRFSE